jgi:hypothetical protein
LRSVVFDSGALVALERGDVRMLALAAELVAARRAAHVPAGVVAQVWRASPRRHHLIRLLRAGALRTEAMSEEIALRIGVLLAATGTADVVDAHVALLGRRLAARIATSDPDDIGGLDPTLDLVVV